MTSQTKTKNKAQTLTGTDFLDLVIDSIQDIKGKHIVLMDMRHLHDAPADYFIVCEAESSTQLRAIADNVTRRAKEEAGIIGRSEGVTASKWILVDFFDIVVHIFHPEMRSYYELEELWSDAKIKEFQNI